MFTAVCKDVRVAICLVLSVYVVTVKRCVIAGVRSARMLSWQERLAALRELLLWDHALWLGLRIYTAAQPHHSKVYCCHKFHGTLECSTSSNSCVNGMATGVYALCSCTPGQLFGTCLLLQNGLKHLVSDSLVCRPAHQPQCCQSGGRRGRGQILQQWLLPLWLCCWPTWTLPCQSLLKPTCKIMLRMKKTCRLSSLATAMLSANVCSRCCSQSTAAVH